MNVNPKYAAYGAGIALAAFLAANGLIKYSEKAEAPVEIVTRSADPDDKVMAVANPLPGPEIKPEEKITITEEEADSFLDRTLRKFKIKPPKPYTKKNTGSKQSTIPAPQTPVRKKKGFDPYSYSHDNAFIVPEGHNAEYGRK